MEQISSEIGGYNWVRIDILDALNTSSKSVAPTSLRDDLRFRLCGAGQISDNGGNQYGYELLSSIQPAIFFLAQASQPSLVISFPLLFSFISQTRQSVSGVSKFALVDMISALFAE